VTEHDEHDLACRTCQVTAHLGSDATQEVVAAMRSCFVEHADHDTSIQLLYAPPLALSPTHRH
jgi:hypothetical protein